MTNRDRAPPWPSSGLLSNQTGFAEVPSSRPCYNAVIRIPRFNRRRRYAFATGLMQSSTSGSKSLRTGSENSNNSIWQIPAER